MAVPDPLAGNTTELKRRSVPKRLTNRSEKERSSSRIAYGGSGRGNRLSIWSTGRPGAWRGNEAGRSEKRKGGGRTLDIQRSYVRYFCYDRNNRQKETPRRRRALHPALGRHGGRVGRQPLRQPDPRPAVSRRGADDGGGHRRDARHGAVQRLQLDQGIAGLESDPPGADPRRPPRSFRGRDRHLGGGGADRRRPQGARDRSRGRCAARLRLRRGRRSDHQPGREPSG